MMTKHKPDKKSLELKKKEKKSSAGSSTEDEETTNTSSDPKNKTGTLSSSEASGSGSSSSGSSSGSSSSSSSSSSENEEEKVATPTKVTPGSKNSSISGGSKQPSISGGSKPPSGSKAPSISGGSKTSSISGGSKTPSVSGGSKPSSVSEGSKKPSVSSKSKTPSVSGNLKAHSSSGGSKTPSSSSGSKADGKTKSKKKPGHANSPSPSKKTLQKQSSVASSSSAGHSSKNSQSPHSNSTGKKATKREEASSDSFATPKPTKKEKEKVESTTGKSNSSGSTKAHSKSSTVSTATSKKGATQNGSPVKRPPSGKKMPGSVKSGSDTKTKPSKNPTATAKLKGTVVRKGHGHGKGTTHNKANRSKVSPKKHTKTPPRPETPKSPKEEKPLDIVSSSTTVGVVTRRASRSTSASSSASATSSPSSSSDSSSDSSNESSGAKSNEEEAGLGKGPPSVRSSTSSSKSKPKPTKSRLSSTSTSTSTNSGSSSSSSSDEDESEKTPVVRAPPGPPAKTAQNRLSKKDEMLLKKPRKKPTPPGSTASNPATPSVVVEESKLEVKARSSSSCSSSVERRSTGSSTSGSSRSRSSAKRRGGTPKSTKTELSIATCSEENQVPDVIQKHWQQIPRVKAKPPTTTTLFLPSSTSDEKDKGSAKEDNDIDLESELASSRPVTRRQISSKKKTNKTIPTTTKFSLDKLHEKLEGCSNSPRIIYNDASDSDYSCGSGDNQVFIRCVPAKSSLNLNKRAIVEDTRVCMFPGCDSNGHLSGLYDKHCLISCCPKYHIDSGFFLGRGEDESRTEDVDPGSGEDIGPRNPSEECQQLSRMRSNRMTARTHYTPASSNPLTLIPTSNHQKLFKNPNKHHPQPQEVKQWVSKLKELKDTKLDSHVSEYDMSLWRDALALAAAQIESEQNASVQFNKWSLAMGKFEMGCWCCNPYPEPLAQLRRIFICEFCLKPVQSGTVLRRHCAKCVWRHPPGDEIYRKDRLSVWEVDGKTQKTYCQYLCLLAKCFLDHKTLYLDVDPFLFYVMTLADSQGCHIVGYFSKEKNSFLNYNVSCILTLPPYMRQGFGRLLIDFSYLLTRVEGKIGSPEKPLSDLGLISYRSYWKDAVLRRMCACASRDVSIKELSQELGIASADLVSTLQFLGMLKYWKGKHLVLKKQDVLEEYLDRVRKRGIEQRQIDPGSLRWRPYQPPPDNSQSQEESISSILNSVVSGGGGATTD